MAGGFIQKAFARAKKKGTLGKCSGKKLGSKSCPKGSKAYNFAMTLKKLRKKK